MYLGLLGLRVSCRPNWNLYACAVTGTFMLVQYTWTVEKSRKAEVVESSGLERPLQYNIDVAVLVKLYFDSTSLTYICHLVQPLTLTIYVSWKQLV